MSFGFLVLPDLAAFETMVERMESGAVQCYGDFGTTVLTLQLDALEELPPRAAAEIEEHGWQAVNGRYPWVELRERDGSLVPVDAHRIEVIIAIATTIGTFCLKAAKAFQSHGENAASITIDTNGSATVRYTMPYEAYHEFGATPIGERPHPTRKGARRTRHATREEPARTPFEAPTLAPPAERAVAGRNEPCPCGSGRKYKHCHLRADEGAAIRPGAPPAAGLPPASAAVLPPALAPPSSGAASASVPRPSQWNTVLDHVFEYATEAFGAAFHRWSQHFKDIDAAEQLLMEWSLFHVRIKGMTAAELYLDATVDLPADVRCFLVAQQAGWLSAWEVQSIERGRGFTARDLLTGEVRRATDRKASESVSARTAILGRIVEWEGRWQLWSVYGRTLSPVATAHVIEAMRKRLRIGRADLAPVDVLRSDRIGKYLIAQWEGAVAHVDHERRNPPRMTTTDGEDLVICTVAYEFDAERHSDIVAALDRMEAVSPPTSQERVAGESVYTFSRRGVHRPAMSGIQGDVTLGAIRLHAKQLIVETNSRERCQHLMTRLLDAVGGWVRERDRTEVDARQEYLERLARLESGSKIARAPVSAVPPAAVLAKLQNLKREHYRRWLDESIPALGNRTPRQAALLTRSREQLDLLLRDMEHSEARNPEWDRFDFGSVRRELGLGA